MSNLKKKITSWLLVIVTVFTTCFGNIDFVTKTYAQETTNYPSVSLEWSKSDFVKGNSFNLETSSATTNYARLLVSYSQTKSENKGYKAGELIITVKGIGAVNRSGVIEATVGADKASSSSKTRDWSYTWNKATDTYTFTNNNAIEANSVFSGYFEMVWTLNSRSTINNYSQNDIVAEMIMSDGNIIKSNTLSFSNKTYNDTFNVGIGVKSMYSYEGISNIVDNPDDYVWIKYNLNAAYEYYKSRGLDGDTTFVFNPDSTNVGDNNYEATSSSFNITNNTSETNGKSYYVSLYWGNNNNYVYVAYPKSSYEGKTVTASLDAYGKYYEGDDSGNTNVMLLASDTVDVVIPYDFGFVDIPGDIYSYDKYSYYDKGFPGYTDEIEERGGDIKGSLMTKGVAQTFYLTGSLNVSNKQTYKMELVDDNLYILLKDSTYRKLTSNDYNFTTVTIPSTNSIKNINGTSIVSNKYIVKVYAMQNDEVINYTNDNLVTTTTITSDEQTISLPKETTSIAVVIEGVTESFQSFAIPVFVNFHLDENGEEDLDFGKVVNTTFIKLYAQSNGEYVWKNNNYTASQYYTGLVNIDLAQDDLDTYGSYLDREEADITFYSGNKGNYSAYTHLSDITNKNSSYYVDFTMGGHFSFEDEYPQKFSLYTVLPDTVSISNYKNFDDIFDNMTLFGTNIDSITLLEHCTPEIITNYKGSGGTYIALHFDLSDLDVPQDLYVNAMFNLRVSSTFAKFGNPSLFVESAVILDDDYNVYTTGKVLDDGSWYVDYPTSDIDNDGNTNELLAYSSATKSYVVVDSAQWSLIKKVKTEYTDDYVTTEDEIPYVSYSSDYSYQLSISSGNNIINDLVLYDCLESGPNSEWQGTLSSIDLSEATKLGLAGTIYYSSNVNAAQDITSSDWTTSMDYSKVKAIAIKFDGQINKGQTLNVIINMVAPTNTSLKDKTAENNYSASCTLIDATSNNVISENEKLESNYTKATLTNKLYSLYITKRDATDNNLLNAGFSLYKQNDDGSLGDLVITKETTNGKVSFKNLDGDYKYVLVESTTPTGYVTMDNKVITFNNSNVSLTILNERELGTITIQKVNDLNKNIYVSNAKYGIYNSNGELVQTVTTDIDGEGVFTNLEWGNYTIKEIEAPNGYQLSDKEYSINIKNNSTSQNLRVYDTQDDVNVHLTKYEADINGNKTSNIIANAVFELNLKIGDAKTSYGLYVTDKNGNIDITDIPYGDYVLREYRSPNGYNKCDDIYFLITPDNKDIVLTAYDNRKSGSLTIVKKDDFGNYVSNAEYTLYKEDKSTVVGTYITDDAGVFNVNNLDWETYYLKETKAPQGYELDDKYYEININASNLSITLNVSDNTKQGGVILTKTDDTETVTLQGATYSLYKNDGSLVYSNLVTDENGQIRVDNLSWGTYYFLETKAPIGYGLSNEKIKFSINYKNVDIIQELNATDTQENKSITITKKINVDDINFANGTPSFIFKMSGIDINGNEHTYYNIITFNEDYVKNNTQSDGYVSQSITFSDFLAGNYTIEEEDTSRYALNQIEDVSNGSISNESVVFNMVSYDTASATFVNKKYENQFYSDSTATINMIKTGIKLTSITVEYSGNKLVQASSNINRDDLVVTAYYDDGTTKILNNYEYELSESKFPNQNGDYTIYVSYTDNNTKKASFDVSIYGAVEKIISIEATLIPYFDSETEEGYESNEIFVNSNIDKNIFQVIATYNGDTQKTLSSDDFIIDTLVAPSDIGEFEITIKLNPDNYSGSELLLSSTVKMMAIQNNSKLIDGKSFNSLIPNTTTSIIFTNVVLPDDITISSTTSLSKLESGNAIDVSEAKDESILAWLDGTTMYVSNPNGDIYANEDSSKMFYEKINLNNITFDNFDTSKITNMYRMFYECISLTELDLNDWNTSKVTNMSQMFAYDVGAAWENVGMTLTTLRIDKWDTSNVTNMGSMFYGNIGLTTLDLNDWDTSQVTNMVYMFKNCISLIELDLNDWDTSNVTNMSYMFASDENDFYFNDVRMSLTTLKIDKWNTSNVTNMSYMFSCCASLTTIDISKWNTSNVTNMSYMFYYCSKLTTIDVSNFNTSQVTNMSYMFRYCSKLTTIDVSNFDTSNVTSLSIMFGNCSSLTTLDLNNWDISNVKTANHMFVLCTKLTTIYAGDWTTNSNIKSNTNGVNMFYQCTSLPNWSSSKTSGAYAKPTSSGGYFTTK